MCEPATNNVSNKNDWSLVAFTIALQLSCGLSLVATWSDCIADSPQAARIIGMAIFPVIAISLLAALLHLGRPLAAWKSLLNVKRSRLSQEILLTTCFAILALVYGFLCWADISGGRARLGVAVSIAGLAAVASSALIYMVPTRPAWNSGWVPVSFFATVLLLGGSAALALAGPLSGDVKRTFGIASITGASLLMISAFWMLLHLSRMGWATPETETHATRLLAFSSRQRLYFAAHLALGAVAPALLSMHLWPVANTGATLPSSLLVTIGLLAAICGTIAGRFLMYALPSRETRF
jgi:anaerobic dimethyl sulfoxide reductase subunit C (anchor subunit)